jgi:diaminohydroxyphosphoribosylaminopyrimidine deaminase/5-amino-6-(5-phosphoribosylamino)uracil reductase
MTDHKVFMHRCLELAKKGSGFVAPNPMVGSVLVYEGRIIGEGWHKQFGGPHAEVNCLQSVMPQDRHLIPISTLYVSLEPCSHKGKTPPCTGLILKQGIKKVVVGCEDPFPAVSGSGIRTLQENGVDVEVGVLANLCRQLNLRFITYHQKHRPYIILKWAQTADGFIGTGTSERLLISNNVTNKLVHKWRSEEAAILVGTNTARLDNPLLTARWGNQPQPVRMVIDRSLKLKKDLRIFTEGEGKVFVFNELYAKDEGRILYKRLLKDHSSLEAILDICYKEGIQSVLVEGGRKLLQAFIDEGLWDEARVVTATNIFAKSGIASPFFHHTNLKEEFSVQGDRIQIYLRSIV